MALKGSRILIVTAVVISVIVMVPIGFLIFGMFWSASPGLPGEITFTNIQEGWDLGQHAALFANTGIFAVGSTILAIGIGVALSYVLQRTDTPGRRVFDAILLLSFVFPSFLMDLAWIFLLSPRIGLLNLGLERFLGLDTPPFNIYTPWGMIWSQGLGLGALAYFLIHPAFTNMDPSLEEAARVAGASVRKSMTKITLPILYPTVLSTSLFLFVISLRSFETPTFIGLPGGIKVYMSAIYENAQLAVPTKHGVASAQATVFLVIMVAILIFYLRTTRRLNKYVSITGKGYRPNVIRLGKWRPLTLTIVLTYMVLGIFLPLAIMLFVSLVPFYTVTQNMAEQLTLDNYATILSDDLMRNAAVNSTLIATAAALLTTVAGALLAYMAMRTNQRGKRVFEAIGTLPLGYPGLVFGLALLWAFLTIPVLREYIFGTPWALVIAYLVIFLPISIRSLSNTLIQIHAELEEAAHVSGASWLRSFRSITMPLMKVALINTFILIFLNSYRELGTAVLLSGPGMYVFPVVILFFWRIGWLPQVAAATVIFGGIMIAVLSVARILLKTNVRRPRKIAVP